MGLDDAKKGEAKRPGRQRPLLPRSPYLTQTLLSAPTETPAEAALSAYRSGARLGLKRMPSGWRLSRVS